MALQTVHASQVFWFAHVEKYLSPVPDYQWSSYCLYLTYIYLGLTILVDRSDV